MISRGYRRAGGSGVSAAARRSVASRTLCGAHPPFAVEVTLATTDPREHRQGLGGASGVSLGGEGAVSAAGMSSAGQSGAARSVPAAAPGGGDTRGWARPRHRVSLAVPRLREARWTAPDGCDSELRSAGLGRLLQVAGMRWAVDGKSPPRRLVTVAVCSCVSSGDLRFCTSAGSTAWNVSGPFFLALAKLNFLIRIPTVKS